MLDAYAVRKAIPRIVLAVIGINLSIYLCVAAVDATNVIAQGVAQLLIAPFAINGMTVFDVDTDASNGIAAGVGIALAAGPLKAASISAFTAIASQGPGVILGGLGSLTFLLIPLGLLALAIVITVVIRQALLFFLIVVSPVAIACYILPGTEKYFRSWADLFMKTLIVYPIIAIIFAMSDVFASIIFSNNAGGVTGIAKIVTGIVVIYAPLFLIPFAFKFAGGALSRIAAAATGVGDKMGKSGFVKARREYYGQKHADNMTRGRAEAYRNASAKADIHKGRGNRVRAFAASRRASSLSGYQSNILDREAEINARTREAQGKTSNDGDDSVIRAYTVNKKTADEARRENRGEGSLWRHATDSSGNRTGAIEYQSAGGSWQNEQSVDEAQRKYGKRNVSQFQQSMSYEMKKAATQQQQDNLVRSFGETADEWGMSDNQANGAWIGAGFANQDSNLQWKHGRWDGGSGSFQMGSGGANLITEMDEKKGSYEAGRMNADTWTTMSKEVQQASGKRKDAKADVDRLGAMSVRDATQQAAFEKAQKDYATHDDTLHRAARIVDSVRTVHEELGPDGKPTGSGRKVESIGAGASGRTKEEMRAFAEITDRYAGKYQEQGSFGGPSIAPRPAGHVEDAIDNTDSKDTTSSPANPGSPATPTSPAIPASPAIPRGRDPRTK